MTQDTAQAGVGTAHLSSELDDDGPFTIHGVALGAGDVTLGNSGIKKKWPGDELQEAAETLAGKPLVRDHQNDSEGTIGTVTKATYREGVGVLYEAEIAPHYEEVAKDIASGILEVSARAYHDPVSELEEDESTGALKTTNIVFDNLSVVSQGAAPSNTANIGEASALAHNPGGDTVAVMEQGAPRMEAAELAEVFEAESELATHDFEEGDWVKGQSSGGTWHGKVRGMKMDGCYSDEIDGDQEICAGENEPVYLIENYDPESGEFTDTMVAHKEGSVSAWDHDEASKAYVDVMAAELETDDESVDEVYGEWQEHVNMSASELEQWADHPCSDKASKDPEAVRERNMMLLETNKSDWGEDEMEAAKRTISFISRMADEENEPDDPKDGPNGCPSEWAISLLNWAHNPFDSMPDVPDEMEEENRMDMEARPDESAMPRADRGNTPEWEEGDLVRWQVEPDLFGTIVHVDEEKHVAMVEIMGMEDGSMTSTGFTITAGFSDIKPMKMPEAKTDMSMHGEDEDDMAAHVPDEFDVDALAEVNGLDINGTVMWADGKMGVISDFMQEDGSLMVEIDVLEREDGSFEKTGETVTAPIHETESMSALDPDDTDTEELQSISTHTPEFSATVDQEWNKPSMEDFTDAESWEDLSEDEQSSIANHFIASKSGFPPENFGDLALPVVEPDGALNLNALANAKARAGQVEGLSGDTLSEVESMIDRMANENFEDASFGDDEEENSANAQADDRSVTVATLSQDDDARHEHNGQSTRQVAALTINHDHNETMTNIDYQNATEDAIEEMDDPVVMEESDVEDLSAKAERAEELDDRLDSVNSTLDELADNQEALDEVDDDQIEELREYDNPTVLTDEEYEELTGLVDEIGGIFADELADYSPFDAEELQDRFTPMELREKVEEHDEASVESELSDATESETEPKGESASSEELESSDTEAEVEQTAEELREAVASKLESDGLTRQASKVRDGEISLDEMGIDPAEVAD